MDYLFLSIAIIAFSVQFVFTKKYQTESSGGVYSGAFYSMIYGLILCIAFFILSSFNISFSMTAIAWALVYSVSAVLCQICTIFAMQKGSVGVVTMFILSGGLLLPFCAGVLFWNERIGVFKPIGCIFIVLAFIYQNAGGKEKKEKVHYGYIVLCAIIFLSNGFISIASKAHQISENGVETNNFLFICAGFTVFLSALVFILSYKHNKRKGILLQRYKLSHITCIFGYALMNGTGNYFSLTAAKTLDASIQFPLLSAAIVCITSALAFMVFKERLKRKDAIAIAINSLGIICFLFAI